MAGALAGGASGALVGLVAPQLAAKVSGFVARVLVYQTTTAGGAVLATGTTNMGNGDPFTQGIERAAITGFIVPLLTMEAPLLAVAGFGRAAHIALTFHSTVVGEGRDQILQAVGRKRACAER